MEHLLLIIIGILLLIIFVLVAKVYFLRKSAQEIAEAFRDRLTVDTNKNGCVTFSNTAHNLNAVTVGRLFDRFYTVESSRNSTGLGLSIAKLLIERMGGTISAQYAEHKLNIVIKM